MAYLSAEDIYVAARHAGFSPDQAVTMTAIALAESRGNPDAHNGTGEDSWGLWQINFDAHPDLQSLGDPTSPMVNARMAFEVSKRGGDIGRWTVTHRDRDSPYLAFREEAERAAYLTEPEVGAHGQWDPPQNYHDSAVAAGAAANDGEVPALPDHLLGSGDAFIETVVSQIGHAPVDNGSVGATFLRKALAQQGDDYVFGHETDLDDFDPDTFDCSELVEWAAKQAGVTISDGSWYQYQHVQRGGGEMSIEEALRTPGALLFTFGSDPNGNSRPTGGAHVAISLGDGRTIEARGRSYGVEIFEGAADRRWTHAGVIPEIGSVSGIPLLTDPVRATLDSDGDGLSDRIEVAIGTNPFNQDTDRDGFIDSVEIFEFQSDPTVRNASVQGRPGEPEEQPRQRPPTKRRPEPAPVAEGEPEPEEEVEPGPDAEEEVEPGPDAEEEVEPGPEAGAEAGAEVDAEAEAQAEPDSDETDDGASQEVEDTTPADDPGAEDADGPALDPNPDPDPAAEPAGVTAEDRFEITEDALVVGGGEEEAEVVLGTELVIDETAVLVPELLAEVELEIVEFIDLDIPEESLFDFDDAGAELYGVFDTDEGPEIDFAAVFGDVYDPDS